ncbi:hypothetical protein N172_20365 [Pantoea dispersa EGD-AAK13]|nr:hypothetical protein N172_20365 [Pantoea dispersa EGD-AAK13]
MTGKKINAQLIFQLTDAKTNGRLREVKRFSSTPEMTRSAHFEESFQ